MRFDEKGLNDQPRLLQRLKLCKQYGIRPTMLLNAHQGVPCPVQFFSKKLVEDAPKGSTSVKLADTKDLVIGYSGLNGLSDYWAAEALITAIDEKTNVCQLSKPLPKDLKAGNLPMATLKYLPLYPAGSKSFEDTANGWVTYAMLVCQLVADAGIEDFDVEIWNELTFGTKFLSINNYYSPKLLTGKIPDFLNEGGNCWELGRLTVNAVKAKYPKARCIWGFSNTTFHHCAVDKLPPRMDGQSYHPYGTGVRSLPKAETHKDHPEYNLERYTPTLDIKMSEGWAHTFIQTECIIRLLNPEARRRAPKGTERFYHYITEHGVVPAECGITDEAGEWNIKTKCALRSFCMWLNKGVDVMHYFQAWAPKSADMGLLPPNLKTVAADATFDQVATPPMKAIRNLTRAFAGATPIDKPAQLQVDYAPVGPVGQIFPGDATHPPLSHRDVLAILPFQVTANKMVIAVYVMTYDAAKSMPEETYRLKISGLPATDSITLYDPIIDKPAEVKVVSRQGDSAELELRVSDTPRLLMIGK